MQTENRLFDDLARVASGALHALGGLREEIEMRVRERLERFATEMNLVTREEFEAVRAMAQKAREEQEALAARVAALEAEIAALRAAPERSATRRRTTRARKAPSAPDTSGGDLSGPSGL
jgi:BMFP domain-containing protein YqiC